MNSGPFVLSRAWLVAVCVQAAICLTPGLAVAAGSEVGFVSAVKGRPQLQNGTGRLSPLTLMQPLAPGAIIVLRANESVGFCHESASRIYRVEGAGVAYIGDVGVNTEPGGAKVLTAGVCTSSATPSETGGVLLRSIRPPASPK
jgi:hypothetical protein